MATGEVDRTAEQFFDGFPDGLKLYAAVEASVRDIGEASVHVTKSQIAFRRRKAFAYLWRPGQYVKAPFQRCCPSSCPTRSNPTASSPSRTPPRECGCTTSNSTTSTRSTKRSATG